jgi:GT2 family glycosyltransferase
VREAAEVCDDARFYMIGEPPDSADVPSNVVFLGPKPIEVLPAYLQHCHAALLPFVPGKISDAVSPVKIFEYLFMGKPVIATPLPEIKGMPNVHIADTPQDFAALCRDMPCNETGENDLFIAKNSWSCRADTLLMPLGRRDMSVVILMHNNRQIIGRCLETLIMHGRYDLKEVIVVDNASSDGGAEYVKRRFPDVILVKNCKNGCSSGRNLGAARATGDYLIFFDSDQWFTSRSFFEEARAILSNYPDVGAAGWSAGWFEKGRKDLGGMIVDYLPDRGVNKEVWEKGFRTDIGYLATSGFFIRRKLFEQLDGFDEYYDPTCFEDTDLSFQVKRAGYKIAFRDFTGIRHQPHQTTRSGSREHQRLFERNASYMREKWKDFKEFFIDYQG